MDPKGGLIILDKGEGMTSLRAVKRVMALFGTDKGGHSGTLDPMATGVLPVMLGRATGASSYLTESEKHYLATMRLGITTDTEDTSGKILSESDMIPDESVVRAACLAHTGEILQTPPMYSAISIGGVRLHELARRGKTVERKARPITIRSLSVERIGEREYSLDVVCSKGTYIRTLCADIGATIGCGAAMSALRRLEAAGFDIKDAHTIEELSEMSHEERLSCLVPTDAVFSHLPELRPQPFFERLAKCGAELYQKKIGTSFATGERVLIRYSDSSFALGEVRDFEGGSAIKPIKQF